MAKRRDEWDRKYHHYHSTPTDDEKAGIRRCVSCGRPIVVGAECPDCGLEHPGTAAAGWFKWGIKKIFGKD
jgi:hypothetical protein